MHRLPLVLILFATACSDEPASSVPAEPASVEVTASPSEAAVWAGRYTFDDANGEGAWLHALDLSAPDSARMLTGSYTVDGPDAATRMNVRGDVMGDSLSVVLMGYTPGNAVEVATLGSVLFLLVRPSERPALLETQWRALRPMGRMIPDGGASFRRSAELVVEAGGLRVVNPITGSARPLPFGMTRSSLLEALADIRGKADEQGVNEECGAGPLGFAGWHDGLTLQFSDDHFAGWTVGTPMDTESWAMDDRPTTMTGIRYQSTWADVQAPYAVSSVDETTLGWEFTVGDDLFGLLGDAPSDTARVDLLWSGVTCFFR